MKHNPIRWIGFIPLLAVTLVPAAGADAVQCPAKIEVRQQIAAPVSGWTARMDDAPISLAGITFFDGKPEDKASLAPDSETKKNGKLLLVWTFADTGATWVACRYSLTKVILTKPLPKGIRSCTVTYNTGVTIAGLPEIEKIDCK